jgi:diguanylate cyclase (GGDEF)-like protein
MAATTDAPASAAAHFALGERCEALPDHESALEHFAAALAAAAASGDRKLEAEAHRRMAYAHDNMGSFPLALEHHLAALRILEEAGDERGRAHVLRTIGVSASKSKDHEQGLVWYHRSLEIARRTGDRDAVARTLNNIGLDLKNLGRLEESLAALEEALGLFRALGMARFEAQALGNRSHTLELLRRDAEAEAGYLQAIAMCRSLGVEHGLANALIGLGRMGVRQGRLDRARQLLSEGLELSERAAHRPDVAEALEALAQLEKLAGNDARALANFERFHEVTRSMVMEESQRRLKGLELRLRVDQAQRETQEERLRGRELAEAYERLQAAAAEKNDLLALLERQSREDPLTGLANRRHMERGLADSFDESRRTDAPLCLALLEIDDFQRVNDSFSRSAGDAALRETARILRGSTPEGDLAARFGGEQFALVLHGLEREEAARLCERIRGEVEGHDWIEIHQWLKVTVSVGIVEASGQASAERMLAECDARLRAAKDAGGNRIVATGAVAEPAREPSTAASANPRAAMMLAEQVRGSYANLPIAVAAGLIVAALLCLVVRDLIPVRVWSGWLAAMASVTVGLWLLHRAYQRRRPAGKEARRWGRLLTAGALCAGSLWGLGTLLLHTPDSIDYQIMVAATAAIVGSSVAFASATYLPPILAFFYPAVIPTAIVFLGKSDNTRLVTGLMLAFYLPIVTRFAIALNRTFVETLRLRFQNVALVGELRERHQAAQEANKAKSRFLAAASHDLRQPMHALGLFLQALRQGRLDERERQLVENIGESFNAMDGLFNALLDVSRLDAGVVEPRIATFRVSRLLDRMRNEYAAQAAAKGLALAVRPCGALVRSDPVLLEEIVGNFLSNAIRHTASGRIVVGCRRAGDDAMRIEVWDTGPGIAADKQGEVFREFVQLDNGERDRRKGLGLGLAIVDRLSRLLDHPVELRSVVGRGSVFRVRVPLGIAAEEQAVERYDELPALPLQGRFVVVVDDEPTVLEAMGVLLTGWGLQVATADSGAMILGKLANASRKPDLVLCDYRLRNGESGTEVIRAIREEFNEEIPAMLITGDTGPERLKEARESGLPLLHKPVRAARLRAMMGQLLRDGEDA